MPRFGHAVLGGTFDRFHVGHVALLATAFHLGRRVSIGLTTGRFLTGHPKPGGGAIQPYAVRYRALTRWLARHYGRSRWRVVPLDEPFGGSVGPGVDVLVVSAETRAGGRAVNAERSRRGLRPVRLVVVPLVLADDLRPVSSRRIRRGEVDPRGRRRAPIRVGISTNPATDAPVAVRGVRRALRSARVRVVPPGRRPSGVRDAAWARRLADRAVRRGELAVGIVRRAAGGWAAVERSRGVALGARSIPGRTPADLASGVARLLAPARPQPL